MKNESKMFLGDSNKILPTFDPESVDLMVTDPPYGIGFMGKDWDKAIPSVALWKGCYRVLKPGAFAFVMSIPRQDCLSRMICRLEDAGFDIGFTSIYWTYASGFPKAQNLSKAIDKRAGAEREIIGEYKHPDGKDRKYTEHTKMAGTVFAGKIDKYSEDGRPITIPTTEKAKALEGAYSGFQPKPAVEVVIVVMKPLEEKTHLDQAIKNGHGCTWLDDCRLPFDADTEPRKKWEEPSAHKEYDVYSANTQVIPGLRRISPLAEYAEKGRFPANLLCEDDVLNDGAVTKSQGGTGVRSKTATFKGTEGRNHFNYGDKGSFSRYFSLDAWFEEGIKRLPQEAKKTFPCLTVPKASRTEKNKHIKLNTIDNSDVYNGKFPDSKADKKNTSKHPTIKPLKLMSWLIMLGSREGDLILDPFIGSGTTYIAATALGRYCKGIEMKKEYYDIAIGRSNLTQKNISMYF